MCGFFAAIGKPLRVDELREAAMRISHRGPDGNGEISEKCFYGIHYRLSIIDLHERSLQPFKEKECVLLFNGEIYNYKSLKSYLNSKYDIGWRTTGDTEVLFHGLFYEGKEFVNKINGIFAFVYYNLSTKSYLAARDRLGVKPLYLRSNSNSIEFCSEVKGFQNYADRLNYEAINEYLSYQFYLDGKTPFSGITEVKPATVIVGCPGKQELCNYWEEKPTQFSSQEAFDKELEELLEDSINLRLVSDVPVGMFLSGGIDSSVISAFAGDRLSTAWCFKDELNVQLDESKFAEYYAKLFGIPIKFVGSSNFISTSIEQSLDILDYPEAGHAVIPLLNLNMAIAGGEKVMLSGVGGDEIFAGYGWHQPYFKSSRILRKLGLVPQKDIKSNWVNFWLSNGLFAFLSKSQKCKMEEKLRSSLGDVKSEGDLMRYEQETWLKALLRIEDMCSMKFGVEVREPLLDYRIVELARSADIQSFAHKGLGKRPLVSLLEKRSERRYTRRDKKGFSFDVRSFLPADGTIRNYCEKLNLSYSERLSTKQKWMITNVASLLH